MLLILIRHLIINADTDNNLEISCSPDLIVQMLDKLISNAVDFSRQDTPVSIKVIEGKEKIEIQVINFGPPLPENLEEQLFSSMISVRDSKDKSEPHLGLGLYIARLIAEFHEGELEAKNLETGEGVVFTVKLPRMGKK